MFALHVEIWECTHTHTHTHTHVGDISILLLMLVKLSYAVGKCRDIERLGRL